LGGGDGAISHGWDVRFYHPDTPKFEKWKFGLTGADGSTVTERRCKEVTFIGRVKPTSVQQYKQRKRLHKRVTVLARNSAIADKPRDGL